MTNQSVRLSNVMFSGGEHQYTFNKNKNKSEKIFDLKCQLFSEREKGNEKNSGQEEQPHLPWTPIANRIKNLNSYSTFGTITPQKS